MESFLFYDLETSGREPRWHRIMQFAAIRTDADLRPIGEPLQCDVRLDPEVLPEPEACLITGLTPQRVAAGIDEGELFRLIASEFGRPRTCVAGYNNLRFDDEFIRFGLWRNLRDPYAREWQGRNSRWDLIDLARMAAALRPEGMVWPRRDDRLSFRLEDLAAANDIEQTRAHDALVDVRATVGLARALRRAQPQLFDYHLTLRRKQRVAEVVGRPLQKAFLHVAPRHGSDSLGVAVVTAVAAHPVNRNAMILLDLMAADHDLLVTGSAEDLAGNLFSTAEERGGEARLPLFEIALNKVPAVAPLGVLAGEAADRLGLDVDACLQRLAGLRAMSGLSDRVAAAFSRRERESETDVDGALYDGFLPDEDRRLLTEALEQSTSLAMPALQDERARELWFRYVARRHPDSLDADGREAWQAHLKDRLVHGRRGLSDLATMRERLEALAGEDVDPAIVADLRAWLEHCAQAAGLNP